MCTDLAARGLDLDVDHVIMFDFPLNSVSIISMVSFGLFFWFPLSSSYSSSSLFFFFFQIISFQFFIWCFNPTFVLTFRLITFIAREELLVWVQKVCNKLCPHNVSISLSFSSKEFMLSFKVAVKRTMDAIVENSTFVYCSLSGDWI